MTRIESTTRLFVMGAAWAVLAIFASDVSCFAQDLPTVSSTPVASDHDLFHKYVWSTLVFEGAIHATLASGFDQWSDAPHDWGVGVTGYARRWVSNYAESTIEATTKYAIARMLHHDPSSTQFTRCECSGFVQRLGHAAGSPFLARTRDGGSVLSPATVAGMLAGYVVPASTWYPAPQGARDGLRHVASDVVGKIAADVFREFWPRRGRSKLASNSVVHHDAQQ